jgi:hypothetical protein
MADENKKNDVIFEDSEKKLARELIYSSDKFSQADVKALAEIGALSVEDASIMIQTENNRPISGEKEHCKNKLHKKAVLMVAMDKNDPDYQAFIEMHAKMKELFQTLDEKYGEEATVNQGSLLGKLSSKLGNVGTVQTECAKKIAIFA